MSGLNKRTSKNKETRYFIGEALIQLMQKTPMEEIRISTIVKTAGVSRMTYYLYYDSKIDVLNDYVHEIVMDYHNELLTLSPVPQFNSYTNILYCLHHFRTCSHLALTLEHQNLYYLFQNALNHYMETYVKPSYTGSAYELYYYSGALANLYLRWVLHGMQESEEELADLIYRMNKHPYQL